MLLAEIIVVSCIIAGCAKEAGDTATDTVAASAPAAVATDHSADVRAIMASDSAWMRNVISKNVDSLMTYYAPEAVSYGFGAPASGIDQIRTEYTNMAKSTITNPKFNPGTVSFSNDGSMAFDYGTYSMTVKAPGEKASIASGAYLNVWKKLNGQWKLMAEMSTPVPLSKN
jgi:ketosteroid isomerase-like protein